MEGDDLSWMSCGQLLMWMSTAWLVFVRTHYEDFTPSFSLPFIVTKFLTLLYHRAITNQPGS